MDTAAALDIPFNALHLIHWDSGKASVATIHHGNSRLSEGQRFLCYPHVVGLAMDAITGTGQFHESQIRSPTHRVPLLIRDHKH